MVRPRSRELAGRCVDAVVGDPPRKPRRQLDEARPPARPAARSRAVRARARCRRSSAGCRRRGTRRSPPARVRLPTTAASCSPISRTVTLRPLPMFTTSPSAPSRSSASANARATSCTETKSRRWRPSSKIARRAVVQQPRREDREHAGVRIRERLARAVRVEQPQRDRRDPVRGADDEAGALLVVLRQRVDRRRDRARLRSGVGSGSSPGSSRLAPLELLARPLRRLDLRRRRPIRYSPSP